MPLHLRMAFWTPKREGRRERDWTSVVQEFEMVPAPELAERLREHYDLGSGDLAPIHELTRAGQPQVVAFDQFNARTGPLGRVTTWRTGVVIRSQEAHTQVSLRASAKRHAVLEGLEAGRSGAQRLDCPEDPTFNDAISVYARESAGALPLLTAPVRTVLMRLLVSADQVLASSARGARERIPRQATGVAPSVVIGPRSLFLALEAETPFPLESTATAIVAMLSLHAALMAATGRHAS